MSSDLQIPTNPEFGPANSTTIRVVSGTADPSFSAIKEIRFNESPLQPEDPKVDPVADPETFLAGECIKKPLQATQQAAAVAMGEIKQK